MKIPYEINTWILVAVAVLALLQSDFKAWTLSMCTLVVINVTEKLTFFVCETVETALSKRNSCERCACKSTEETL